MSLSLSQLVELMNWIKSLTQLDWVELILLNSIQLWNLTWVELSNSNSTTDLQKLWSVIHFIIEIHLQIMFKHLIQSFYLIIDLQMKCSA